MTQLLTPAEARKLLRVGRTQFYSLIKRREIAVVKIGPKYLVQQSEIEKYIQQQIIPAKREYFKHRRANLSSPARVM